MVHVAVNKYDFEKNQHFRVHFWGGDHQKGYAVYAFINVDNCERPLTITLSPIRTSREIIQSDLSDSSTTLYMFIWAMFGVIVSRFV